MSSIDQTNKELIEGLARVYVDGGSAPISYANVGEEDLTDALNEEIKRLQNRRETYPLLGDEQKEINQ